MKTDDLDNRSRRNNLCFEGIAESNARNETWDQSEAHVKKIISDHMDLDVNAINIERAHRVGPKKSSSEKPRAIVAKFLDYKDREMVFKAKRNLKGTNVFVREDYSERVAEKRKNLIPKMMEERKKGKKAYLRFDKLIVQDFPPIRPPGIPNPSYFRMAADDPNASFVVNGPRFAAPFPGSRFPAPTGFPTRCQAPQSFPTEDQPS